MPADLYLFHALNNLAGQSPLIDGVIVFCASYLAYILIALFVIVVIASRDRWKDKLYFLIVTALSTLVARFGVTELIRFFYHRPRPFSVLPVHQLLTDTAWSFPSGHATFFFAMATAIYLYNKKWGIVFFIATVLITLGRVIAGIHYPSDIIGGAIIGIIVAHATFYFASKMRVKRPHQTY